MEAATARRSLDRLATTEGLNNSGSPGQKSKNASCGMILNAFESFCSGIGLPGAKEEEE